MLAIKNHDEKVGMALIAVAFERAIGHIGRVVVVFG
jgi:hypothetical protein